MNAKRVIGWLATVVLTAAFTYLIVANRFYRERAAELESDLARVQSERARLEEELWQVQTRARTPGVPPFRLAPWHSITNSPQPSAPSAIPRIASPVPSSPVPPVETLPHDDGGVPAGGTVWMGGVPFPGDAWIRFLAVPSTETRCVVEGKADTRDWQMIGRTVSGYLDLDFRCDFAQSAESLVRLLGSNLTARAEVTIPVRSLKSQVATGASVMERTMQQTMNAHTYDSIQYRLTGLVLEEAPTNQAAPWRFTGDGYLVVNGVALVLKMPVTIEPFAADRLRIEGVAPLRMTDFKLTPPAPVVLGKKTKVEDVVKVSFTWIVARESRAMAGR